ncbi:MAG: class I tRNA ligase family protein [Bacteroidota bacterium]
MIDYAAIERKWRAYWDENETYRVTENTSKPKYYVLDMFPYPSGAGLHVGHPLGYIASDIFSRHKRMSGYNVLHPMGFDAFGLPAEQYALQTGIHPAVSTQQNMERYREQLSALGFSFDWSRELYTCDPNYYRWTQWIFIQLYEHYYDNKHQKALPITSLVATFESTGNSDIDAANSCDTIFSAAEWMAMNRNQQEDILMQYRLAFKKIGYVNWCEELGTVLANDQVKDGVSERGGFPVVQKAMSQWYLRITAYADRLLYDLESVDWSHALKTMQRNWIGRSEGASVWFAIEGSEEKIEIFTTRIDTIYGATYMVLAPEHDLVRQLTTEEQQADVNAYLAYTSAKSEVERMAEKKVTGTFIGAYAINPFTNDRLPIYIGEYVLKDYGTGAIMAVPSDDDRDKAFAQKFDIPIIDVVDKTDYPGATLSDKVGKLINSDFLNGLEVKDAIKAATEHAEKIGVGKAVANYKMRDANFSRQRYWGEPFPITYDSDGIAHPVANEHLPVVLPDTQDFKPAAGGLSPLARLTDWVTLSSGHTRETDTMPAVAGSSWYYLRYMDPSNDENFASPEAINYWQSVDLYVGGAEHAVAHLLYARFWHKFLYDKGLVPTTEPFKKLINQGMIQGTIEFIYLRKNQDATEFVSADLVDTDEGVARIPVHVDMVSNYGSKDSVLTKEGLAKFIEWRPIYTEATFTTSSGTYTLQEFPDSESFVTLSEVGKMSKSKYNVINPDEVIGQYGTDCFRMYEMFLGPIEQSKPWDTKGIDGVSKFLRKFIDMFYDKETFSLDEASPSPEELKVLHTCIKKVNADIEAFSFNTCISAMMIAVNELRKLNCRKREILLPFVQMIAPFAPFLSEELWERSGQSASVHATTYPTHEEKWLVESNVTYPICFNGKKRATESFDAGLPPSELEALARELDYIDKWTAGKPIRKVIVVPGRMINIVS